VSVLAIDQGTSAAKALIVGEDGAAAVDFDGLRRRSRAVAAAVVGSIA